MTIYHKLINCNNYPFFVLDNPRTSICIIPVATCQKISCSAFSASYVAPLVMIM